MVTVLGWEAGNIVAEFSGEGKKELVKGRDWGRIIWWGLILFWS
jgi:hypothetical protein